MPAEFRLLEGHRHGHRHRQDIMDLQIHPGGRLLATCGLDGVRLWDMVTTREIAYISISETLGILFEEGGGGLLTYDSSQLRRWPVDLSSREGRPLVRVGSPRRLLTIDNATPRGRMAFCGPDQERLAITDLARGVNLVELAPWPRVIQSWRTRTADLVAASPDGRWVATGNFEGSGFQVWDTLRNIEARRWDTGGRPTSPSARTVAGSRRAPAAAPTPGRSAVSGRWGPGGAVRASPLSGPRPPHNSRSATMGDCSRCSAP
jgi:hypothetical protein